MTRITVPEPILIPNFDFSGMLTDEKPSKKCEHGKYYSQCGKHPELNIRSIPPDVWEELRNYKMHMEKKYNVRGWREVIIMMVRMEWKTEELI